MAEYEHLQRDFSGGEISGKLFMRDDLAIHAKSVAIMLNYMPTLQGNAVRTPGTRFFMDTQVAACRIIPFLSQSNDYSIVLIKPATAVDADDGTIEIISTASGVAGNAISLSSGPVGRAPVSVWQNISVNPDFRDGMKYWWGFPEQYTSNDSAKLGVWLANQAVVMVCRDWTHANDDKTATLSKKMTVPEDTTSLQLSPQYLYANNFSSTDAQYTGVLALGTTPFSADIYDRQFDEKSFPVGTSWNTPETLTMMADGTTPINLLGGSNIYMTFNITAVWDKTKSIGPSTPRFVFYSLILQTLVTREITTDVVGTVPYLADELDDIHFVQSPYGSVSGSGGKELVLVHPNHPPAWVRFATTAYSYEAIPFAFPPAEWTLANGYPSCCTSFNGRLILAGAKNAPALGSLQGNGTEQVWGTKVGDWSAFSDPDALLLEVNPDDSIDFTAIYRSPIEWVSGHKDLLIGARGMEYVASADGIFQPADIGVSMHSTHGSAHVQPVGLGETVVYPAEGGTRVRAMNFRNDDDGYVSPDLTYMNPTLFSSGIVRMVRMRNPHQLVVCVMGNGLIALLSYDPHVGVVGWSRIQLSGIVHDACVLPDANGVDVLFVTVSRRLDGVETLYIEAFRDWTDWTNGDYLQSSNKYVLNNTNVITGLDHLEGKRVDVVADNNYMGNYIVEAGTITMLNELGDPMNASTALVGLPMSAHLALNPLATNTPGDNKRYINIQVRGVFTTWSEINGERVQDRSPGTLMGNSEPIQWFTDYKVLNLGSDLYQAIRIDEYVPYRSELLGVFGKVKANSL